MSRLWPRQLYLNVQPHGIELSLYRGWGAAKLLENVVVDCTDDTQRGVALPLAHIDQLIQAYGQFARCHLVISNHYIRHLILPAYDASISDAELEMLARHCFKEIYGAKSDAWHIVTDYEHQLACALESEALASLKSICQTHKAKLVSVNSNLVSTYNQLRQHFDDSLQCLIQLEKNQLIIGLFNARRCTRLSAMQFDTSQNPALEPIIHRELLLAGLDEPIQKLLVTHPADIIPPTIDMGITVEFFSGAKPFIARVQEQAIPLAA